MSSNASRVTTVVCAVMMMMMMMTEAAAVPKAGGQSKHPSKTHKLETVPLQLDPNALVPSGNVRSLENASISPWAYNISKDESLFPPLAEARCLLTGCLTLKGQEDHHLESRPIMRQVLLLRRVRSEEAGSGAEQRYHYRLESRLVAVGCTCVRPVVRSQG